MADDTAHSPDWHSPPGDTIADLLDEKGWEGADLADRTGFSCEYVDELIHGRAPLTADAAQRLSAVLGSTAEFWLARETLYREALEQRKL